MRTSALIVDGYDIRILISEAEEKFPGIRDSFEYDSLKDRFIDFTMSCDKQEQVEFMKNRIREGLQKLKRSVNFDHPSQRNMRQGLVFEAFLDIIVAYDLL